MCVCVCELDQQRKAAARMHSNKSANTKNSKKQQKNNKDECSDKYSKYNNVNNNNNNIKHVLYIQNYKFRGMKCAKDAEKANGEGVNVGGKAAAML